MTTHHGFYKWLCLPQNMTIKGGTNQACARCKYQRRKCTSECVLAPYFPPDQPKIFQNAHKLFGVSNILKIIKDLDETRRMEAMRSIKYESNIRDKFPVHGCLGVILQYQYQIQQLEEELYLVQSQIAYYRQQAVLNDSSQLPLGIMPTVAPESQNALALFETPQNVSPISTWPIGSYSANTNLNLDQNDSTKSSNVWIQQPCSDEDNKNNQLALNSQLQALNIQQDAIEDYEFFDTVDDRQSYIHPKEACESSSESSMKNTRHSLEHIAENELKSAAACFSLTNTLAWQKDRGDRI